METRNEIRDDMCIDWNVGIVMDDDLVIRADIYRPIKNGKYPVIMTYGPYGKNLAVQEGYTSAWDYIMKHHPDIPYGSTNKYQSWEVVDPEKWIPDNYVVIRVDARGAGCSPGVFERFSKRELQDYYQCIEWAGIQPWSNGKVGLNGISYYGANQWLVSSLQPPHLAAMCVWEGYADWYRDSARHGGIMNTFEQNWYELQYQMVQYGRGENGPRSIVTGKPACGGVTLSPKELRQNLGYYVDNILEHEMIDDFYKPKLPEFDKITYPLLAASNWGGPLHCRGTIEGFLRAASSQKWLEIHGDAHQVHFYTDYGVNLQKRFFDHFLKEENNGWDKQPKVQLQVRHVDQFVERHENEWPLARTQWTKYHLQPGYQLSLEPANQSVEIEFDAMGDGLTFLSEPFEQETEITGPLAAKLFISSSTTDADLFLVFRLFTPDMHEVTFQGSVDPHTPVDFGWLRASHRKLDPELTEFYRPYHTHDEKQFLQPGVPVELDVELWPTSIVVPFGYRIGLSVRGKDYQYAKETSHKETHFRGEMLGVGPFRHNEPRDRKPEIFGGRTTLHISPNQSAYLIVPLIPPK